MFPLAPRMRYSKMLRKKPGRLKPIHCATFQRITCLWTSLFTHQSMYTSVLTENRGRWKQWALMIQIFFYEISVSDTYQFTQFYLIQVSNFVLRCTSCNRGCVRVCCVYGRPHGERCVWVCPFISSLITVPNGKAA